MEKIPAAEDFLQDHLQISHFYDDKAENMHNRWLDLVDQIQSFKQREKLGI